jgi:hypothetical protein
MVAGGKMVETIATWGAVLSAVAAAALWFWASRVTVKIRPFDQPFDPRHPNDMILVSDEKPAIPRRVFL